MTSEMYSVIIGQPTGTLRLVEQDGFLQYFSVIVWSYVFGSREMTKMDNNYLFSITKFIKVRFYQLITLEFRII